MNIIQWIDHKAAHASNVQKSYLGFARRKIINSGIKHDDINGLCHQMLVCNNALIGHGAYHLQTMLNNTISIIRAFERAQKRWRV